GDEFPGDVAAETGHREGDRPAAEASDVGGRHLELTAEQPADTGEYARPDQAAEPGEHDEAEQRHTDDAGERRRRGAEARHELGDQQRARAVDAAGVLGAAHARDGLERDATETADDAAASSAAEPVPDRVAAEPREPG